ncbi:MAG: pilus assembly protein TadG-related protein, partial [Pseudomonadota bacterium]
MAQESLQMSRLSIAQFYRSLENDTRGTVAIIFGLSALVLALAAGVGVDNGRIVHAKSKLMQAADAASLAAGKALLDGRLSEAEIKAMATAVFQANATKGGMVSETISAPVITINRNTSSIRVEAEATLPMTLTKIAGYDEVTVPVVSSAQFDLDDIELSLALDVTGSMGWGTKLSDLKSATNDLIDIMLPDGGTPNEVRIAFAPYSSGVNAGAFADAVAGETSDGCTYERESDTRSDDAPGPGDYLKVKGDPGIV